jgi:hypothetical protein
MEIIQTAVPASQCPSESAFIDQRKREVVTGECEDIVEHRIICEPILQEKIITGLRLGSGGHDVSNSNGTRFKREVTPPRDPEQVCHHVTVPHDRRSVGEEEKMMKIETYKQKTKPKPLPIDPVPFSLKEHGSQYRRQRRDNCEYQHVLFVLDTSGSIGEKNFKNITFVLSLLLPLFCSPIKVAVMTFDHEYYVQFCFDEYDNTTQGRQCIGTAISSIQYRQGPGTRWTHTAGAARCVCDYMLNETCGFDPDGCITDIVFITDGQANDPTLDVCTEINCLHNHMDINLFVIGIGIRNEMKLECMRDNNLGRKEYRIFQFENFVHFYKEFMGVIQDLSVPGTEYVCANYDQPRPG